MHMNFGVPHNFSRSGPEREGPGFLCRGPATYKAIILVAVVLIFSLLPIIWCNHLPLADYPNHLATIQIRKTLSSNIYLAQFYEFRWLFTPYLGFDLLMTPFISFLPVEIAGKIVIVLTLVMIYVGT